MESIDLIARENEFKKLNKQLEKKTESLMKEIEEVMKKPDIFSTPKLNLNLYNNKSSAGKHRCSPSSPSEDSVRTNHYLRKSKESWKKIHVSTGDNASNLNNATQHDLNEEKIFPNCDSVVSLHKNSADVTGEEKVECVCCVKEKDNISDELGFLYAFVSVSVKDNVLPQSLLKGKVSVESVCKCLAAKIKLMQEQLDKLQNTIEKKNKQCEAHLTHTAELESERLALLNTANTMKSETADMKAKYLAIQKRLNDKERLYKEQRSVTDKLTVEIKQLRSKNGSLEARCASHDETVAALRQQIEAVKLSEKEYRNSTRSLSASHEATSRRLEARLAAMRTRMSQQSALIANLRAQRSLIAAAREVQSLNAQYTRLLQDE